MVLWTEAYLGGTRENPKGVGIPISQFDPLRNVKVRQWQESILNPTLMGQIDTLTTASLDEHICLDRIIPSAGISNVYQYHWAIDKRPDRTYVGMEFRTEGTQADLDWGTVDVPVFENELHIPRRLAMTTNAAGMSAQDLFDRGNIKNFAEDLDDFGLQGWLGAKNPVYGLTDAGTGNGTVSRPLQITAATAVAWDTTMGPLTDFATQAGKLIEGKFPPPFTGICDTHLYASHLGLPAEGPAADQYKEKTNLQAVLDHAFISNVDYSTYVDYDTAGADDSDIILFRPDGFRIRVAVPLTVDPAREDGNMIKVKYWTIRTFQQLAYYNSSAAKTYKPLVKWTSNTVT